MKECKCHYIVIILVIVLLIHHAAPCMNHTKVVNSEQSQEMEMAVEAQTVYRINCGGPGYTDSRGMVWQADAFFNHGQAGWFPTAEIAGTKDDTLYLTERWEPTDDPLRYTFNVAKGKYIINLYFVEVFEKAQAKKKRIFDVKINGKTAATNLDIFARVGGYTALVKSYSISVTDILEITFIGKIGKPKINAIEIVSTKSNIPPDGHTAHAVPGDPQTVVDLNNDGFEMVHLDGSFSHTHAAPPARLLKFTWSEGSKVLGNTLVLDTKLSVGVHLISLLVEDSKGNKDKETVTITVVPPLRPGIEGYYYKFEQPPLSNLPDISNQKPIWGQVEKQLNTPSFTGKFRGSPLQTNFVANYRGVIFIPATGLYKFGLRSDDGSKLLINKKPVVTNDGIHQPTLKSGSIQLKKGLHPIEVQYFNVQNTGALQLFWTKPGGVEEIIPPSAFFYYQSNSIPIIHSLSTSVGSTDGGNKVVIKGYGFVYTAAEMSVSFGNAKGIELVKVDSKTLEVKTPPGTGVVQVVVRTPKGTSNPFMYEYSTTGPVAINFEHRDLLTGIPNPTCLALGPDEKLYVGTAMGILWRITLDDNSNIVESIQSEVLKPRNILGLAFNPRDTDPRNIRFYVAHNKLYHGDLVNDAKGMISIISGARMERRDDIISGLPNSERDHGVNGLAFTQRGDLLFMVGSNTNAGLPGPLTPSGTQREKLFSASCAIAHITRKNFDGHIKYTNDDNEHGTQTGGLDVEVYASGIKNSFNLVYHSNGIIYFTDNGPSIGFGKASTSCTTEGPDPRTIDELNILERNHYYGHPNRARGVKDPRQCVYHPLTEPSTANYTAPIDTLPSSVDGIIEYTANTFNGQLRKHLIIGRFTGELWDVTLATDGRRTTAKQILSPFGGLNVAMNTDGSLISTDYENAKLAIVIPREEAPQGLFILSIFPVRGIIAGGNTVSIRGFNFGQSIAVTLGGKSCQIVSKSEKRIKCKVPRGSASLSADLVITSDGVSRTLSKAYRYLDV